ncbi:hypothetical protein Tco_0218312, partial [Tanacetum coccineum]
VFALTIGIDSAVNYLVQVKQSNNNLMRHGPGPMGFSRKLPMQHATYEYLKGKILDAFHDPEKKNYGLGEIPDFCCWAGKRIGLEGGKISLFESVCKACSVIGCRRVGGIKEAKDKLEKCVKELTLSLHLEKRIRGHVLHTKAGKTIL